jgi:hypothetical protein
MTIIPMITLENVSNEPNKYAVQMCCSLSVPTIPIYSDIDNSLEISNESAFWALFV